MGAAATERHALSNPGIPRCVPYVYAPHEIVVKEVSGKCPIHPNAAMPCYDIYDDTRLRICRQRRDSVQSALNVDTAPSYQDALRAELLYFPDDRAVEKTSNPGDADTFIAPNCYAGH
ncbi:MAG: hypothetical protein NVS2B7_04060 [Herpetosiphon sp.]